MTPLNKLGIDHSDAIVVTAPTYRPGWWNMHAKGASRCLNILGRTAKRPPLPHTMIYQSILFSQAVTTCKSSDQKARFPYLHKLVKCPLVIYVGNTAVSVCLQR